MENMNKIATEQQKIGDDLLKILTNAKKDPLSRRTKENIQKRREAAETLWNEFTENHNRAKATMMLEHNYFQNHYYTEIEKVFRELINVLDGHASTNMTSDSTNTGLDNPTPEGRDMRRIDFQIRKLEDLSEHVDEIIKGKITPDDIETEIEELRTTLSECSKRDEEIHMSTDDYSHPYITNKYFTTVSKNVKAAITELKKIRERPKLPLPEMKIPIFMGNPEEWPTFKDIFCNVVHNQSKLSNIEKFQYLKTHVRGEAGRLIRNYHISALNYDAAWLTLNRRYNNKRLIVNKLLQKIINFPKIHSESAYKLKELHDVIQDCTTAISNLGVKTDQWSPILDFIIMDRWDNETNTLYEQTLMTPNELVNHDDLCKFLMTRFQSLELRKKNYYFKSNENGSPPQNQSEKKVGQSCKMCSGSHHVPQCFKFKKMDVAERNKMVKQWKLCMRCLKHSDAKKCQSDEKCNTCKRPNHHSLLHYSSPKKEGSEAKDGHSGNAAMSPLTAPKDFDVLLATAVVKAKTLSGAWINLRVLLDTGSQMSFISEDAAQMLSLPREKILACITGIGGENEKTSKAKILVEMQPRFPSSYRLLHELMVLKKVTTNLPQFLLQALDPEEWRNQNLADPTFNIPGPIDILLGADAVGEIILAGIKKQKNSLLAQNTQFGWVLSGLCQKQDLQKVELVSLISRKEEDEQLTKFWNIEEINEVKPLTQEEAKCEQFFQTTTTRDINGIYTVRIPFKSDTLNLGKSRKRAAARLLQLEKRLMKDDKLRHDYHDFMREYVALGHMRKAEIPEEGKYYIPHQAVLKEDSSTTKLRVVFDASSKTTSGRSLNDEMYNGPRLQQDISCILLKWRMHKVVFKADIEKMYRQINIHPEDQDYQRILWRFDQHAPIDEYILTTVTYGTTSAPYLAIRTLQQLAEDEGERYPLAAKAVDNFYVDDILSGADSVEKAIKIQQELIAMMKNGGFTLRKWSSNDKSLIECLPKELQDQQEMEMNKDDTKKSLGVHWKPNDDSLTFKVKAQKIEIPTKRKILSEIAKLYDPLGWISPVTITAKIMIQELWIKNLEWDKEVPEDIREKWTYFQENLNNVEKMKIPRWIGYQKDKTYLELHGFCDASEKAYGAVVYSRILSQDKKEAIAVNLLISKSRVAPIKMKKTLPRLELCGAVLLSKLMKEVIRAIDVKDVPIYAWTDSTITLAWIKGDPGRWKNFVANRVVEINQAIPHQQWSHVNTKENPADLVSRGETPVKLQDMDLWWKGPSFLSDNTSIPTHGDIQDTNEEARLMSHITRTQESEPDELLSHFSSLTRMIRVLAYCRRFGKITKNPKLRNTSLTVEDLDDILKVMVKRTQQSELGSDLAMLQKQKQVHSKSSICSLKPFLDKDGIIRVEGRIRNSNLSYEQKHPILIPKNNMLANLIIRDSHQRTLHGGIQLTLSYCRRKYWIIGAKRMARHIIHQCTVCTRYKGETMTHIMGDLPSTRVTPSPPFSNTGLDYAGPFNIRVSKGRGTKSYKGYIAIFVCFVTKAIHIEVVSDMTADAFLAAFRRFVSRRGPCSNIYSDNGTTFVGASKYIQDQTSTTGTKWHFIPPVAPNFGGLWESAVRSMKHHLKRVIGESTLTYEELATITQQTEACLNSRPLWPLSNEPEEIEALTPGHFLIGRALISPVSPIVEDYVINASTRWKLMQKMTSDFWKSWSTEYLHNLQQRTKWKRSQENLAIGDMVLVKDESFPPGRWPLAKIADVHPASDGTVRVVTVRQAQQKLYKRPITKLIRLNTEPVDNKTSDTTKTQPKPRGTHAASMSFHWILLLCISIINAANATFVTKSLPPGLYIEHIGSAKLYRGVFRLEVMFSKKQLSHYGEQIDETIRKVGSLCNQTKELSSATHCSELVHHLTDKQTQYQWMNKSIHHVTTKRARRGLLGKMLTAVFGVNEEVYHSLDALDENQQRLIKISTHQTKLLLKSQAKFQDTELRINKTLQRFTTKLNEVIQIVNKMSLWYSGVDKDHLNIIFLNIYNLASNFIEEVSELSKKIVNVYLRKGDIHDFISPAQLASSIAKISHQLPSNVQILTDPALQTIVVNGRSNISIQGQFIISEVSEFNLVKVTPIPVKMTDAKYWIPEVTLNILAVDYDKQLYFEVTTEELKGSIRIDDQRYVISPTVVRNMENSPNCILDQLYGKTEQFECHVQEEAISKPIWKQLYMPNTWIIMTNKLTKFAVTCNGIREEVHINQTSIIQLSQDCSIKTRQSTLNPTVTVSVPVLSSMMKPIVVPDHISHLLSPNKQLQPEPVIKAFDHLVTHEEDEDDTQTWRKIQHHSAYTSVITFVICTAGILIVWVVAKRIRRYISTRNLRVQEFQMTLPNPESRQNVQRTC